METVPSATSAMISLRPPRAATGKPPPMPLAKTDRSGRDAVVALGAAEADAEAGDHLVENQQHPMLGRQLAHGLEIAGLGQDAAGVAHDRLGEHRGDVVALALERLAQRAASFQGRMMRLSPTPAGMPGPWGTGTGRCRAPPCRVRDACSNTRRRRSRDTCPRSGSPCASGEGARQAHRIEHGLGAGIAQAHLLQARHRRDRSSASMVSSACGQSETVPLCSMKSTTAAVTLGGRCPRIMGPRPSR